MPPKEFTGQEKAMIELGKAQLLIAQIRTELQLLPAGGAVGRDLYLDDLFDKLNRITDVAQDWMCSPRSCFEDLDGNVVSKSYFDGAVELFDYVALVGHLWDVCDAARDRLAQMENPTMAQRCVRVRLGTLRRESEEVPRLYDPRHPRSGDVGDFGESPSFDGDDAITEPSENEE